MADVRPLYWDGTGLAEMTDAQKTSIRQRVVYMHGNNPSVDLSVIASSGSESTLSDTRWRSGQARTSATNYPSTTGYDPTLLTITYDKIDEASESPSSPTDTNNKRYPIYYDGTDIKAMTQTDFFDTFITQAIDLLVDGTDQDGTYRIYNGTSLTGHTLITGGAVYTDTRADLSASGFGSAASTIGTSGTYQDFPTTINTYYLFRTNQGTKYGTPSIQEPLYITTGNDLQEYTSGDFDTILAEEVRYYTGSVVGSRIQYSINGAGNTRGTSMVDSRLGVTNAGTRNILFVNANDYRAQDFPTGTQVTISTYNLNINRA